MVLPLMLVLGLSLGQAPDFLDVQPVGGDYQVLAGGGLVYRWSGRGELVLEAQLGSPATALYSCGDRRAVAVGPKGQVHVSASGLAWHRVSLEGARDLWAAAGSGCERVLLAGDGGLWLGSLTGESPAFTRVEVPSPLPLYGVAMDRERAVAWRSGRRRCSSPRTAESRGVSWAIREWTAFIDVHQRTRLQPAPKDPPRTVAVAPLLPK